MATIWTPKEKPVVLDKFCHLSLDAQKVMAAMYRDFHQRKAEIQAANTLQYAVFKDRRGHQDGSSKDFSRKESHGDQRHLNFEEQLHLISSEQSDRASSISLYDLYRETGNDGRSYTEKTSLFGMSKKDNVGKKQGHNSVSTNNDESMDNYLSNRNFVQAPYREHTSHNSGSPPVETRDFEILSQFHLADTQVDLFSDFPGNSDWNVPIMNQKKSENGQGNSLSKTLNIGENNACIENEVGERIDAFKPSGLKLLEMNGENAGYVGKSQNSLNLLKPRLGGIAKSTEDTTSLIEYVGENSNDRLTDKSYRFNSNERKNVSKDLVRNEVMCEESPYLERTTKIARKSYRTVSAAIGTVGDMSRQKKHKLKQTRIMFERISSENQKDSTSETSSGMKPFIDRECSVPEIPTKMLKICNLSTKDQGTSVAENTIYIKKLPENRVDQVCSQILQAKEIVLCLVFADGSTQFRDNLLTADNKKKMTVKIKKDMEVDGIAVCSVAPQADHVYVFQMQDKRPAVREKLREFWGTLLSRDDIRKIGFRIKEVFLALFANFCYEYNKVDLSWTVMDASVAVWLLDPDKPVSSFKQLLSALNMPQQVPSKSCLDALQADMTLLSAAMEKLFQMLQSKDMWNLFLCLETKLINVLAGMEKRQMTISIHTLLHFSAVLKRNLTRLEEKAHKAAGHAFLLNSHHQLRQVLFEELKLDLYLRGKAKLAKTSVTRETSTSETVLIQLLPFHPLPEIILEYRQLQKLKSTYVDGILSCVSDNYLTTHWDQTSAATGRLTSHHPNIQAIPKIPVTIKDYQANFIVGKKSSEDDGDSAVRFNARDPFISRPHWSLLSADFQQIELRLLGHLADDPTLLNIFNDAAVPDIFNALAAQWLSKDVSDVTEADREQTKRVVYSVMYGVGKEKLADYLKCTPDNAKAIMASFLLKFPAVNKFTKSCVQFCQKYGYTSTIFKRRRLFPNIRHSNGALRAQAERQCVNFCVQGSAADICKAAMLQVENALAGKHGLNARLLIQIHDELLLEVADSDLNYVTELVKSVMESEEKLCGSVVKLKVPIPVSISVGKKWGQMEPVSVKCNT